MNPIYTSRNGNSWIFSKRGLISEEDPSKSISVPETEIKDLFIQYPKALYIRWVSDFDRNESETYYYVLRDTLYDLTELPSKTRNQIRKCLKNCSIEQVNGETIVNGGGV